MRKFFNRLLRKIVKFNIYIYCKIVHRARIEGKENIPKEGALIYCGNHESFLDPAIITATSPRDVRFLAKAELWRFKFLAFFGKVFEEIPVTRDERDIGTVKTVLKALKNGECIGIFPEGTRNGIAKGEQIKDGAAFFALRSGATVIPVGISGNGKFTKVTLRYGKPIDLSGYGKDDLNKVTDIIMEKVLELTK